MLICFFIVVFHLNLIPSATFSAVRKAEWLDSVKLYHVTVLWSKIFYNLEIQASSVVQLFAV